MMEDVIRRGTGSAARVLGRSDLAGKTGTSNDQRDAWFNGFNPDLVAIVWVGFDGFQPLGRHEVGGHAALPAWIDYMRVALDGVPQHPWPMPPDIVAVHIDPSTGLQAPAGDKNSILEVFRKGEVPAGPAGGGGPSSQAGGAAAQSVTQDLF
jgi:penicillin-binding protein 1A